MARPARRLGPNSSAVTRRTKPSGGLDSAAWRPSISFLAGPKATTEAWARGAQGEERVGRLLDQVVGDEGVVLHDRRVPGRRINLDHLVVVASGVWVIDTKHYRGQLARRQVGGWFNAREVLTVAGTGREPPRHLGQ